MFVQREETGIMRLSADAATNVFLYFVEGLIVGAECAADDWLLGRRLVANGVVAHVVLDLAPDVSLQDHLSSQNLVADFIWTEFLVDRFRDNLFQAHMESWTAVDFRATDAALPANAQFGHDPVDLLVEADRWRAAIKPMLQFLPGTSRMIIDPESSPADGEAAQVGKVLQHPMTREEVVAVSPLERYKTLWWLSWLLNRGIVRPASWQTAADSGLIPGSP